jgi:EmrB/QacA subfamily drug resistance transporter
MTTTAAARGKSLTPTRRAALIIGACFFILLLDGAILNTSLPQMANSLGEAPLALSASVTLYFLASAAIVPSSGWIADRFGAKRIFLGSMAVFTLASMACGVSQNLTQLVLARAVQGLAGGLMLPVGRTLVIRHASKAELMDATALITWPALLAPVIGPPLGGFITTYLSWRWNFFLNLPLGLVGLWLALRWVPPADVPRPGALDLKGALLSAGGLVLLLLGLELCSHASPAPRDWAVPVGLVLMGAGLLVWTVRHLRRATHPVVSLAPLGVKTFAIASVRAGTVYMMCLHAMPFLLPFMFQVAFGMTPVHAGMLTLAYFMGNLGMKVVTTPILRRFGFRTVMTVDGVLAALAISACALLTPDTATGWTVAVMLWAGATRSMQFTAINTLAFADIAHPERGAAATLSSVSTLVASTLGVAVSAILLTASQLWHGHPALTPTDFRFALVAMAVIALVSAAGFLRLSPTDGHEVSGHRP